jgi:DNA-binding MarR family transcriptional regulator
VTGAADLLAEEPAYRLDEQVGFILRQVQQRHALIFADAFDDLTPMQWAALAKLAERGECSQNLLGRLVSMDVATVKGVVGRLQRRGLALTSADPDDRRRVVVSLTPAGRELYAACAARAGRVTDDTLHPLTSREREQLLGLLRRLR